MSGNCYFPESPVFMLFKWALAAVQGQEEEFIPWQHHPQACRVVTGWPGSERRWPRAHLWSHNLLFPWAECTLRWFRSYVAMRSPQPGSLGSAALPIMCRKPALQRKA